MKTIKHSLSVTFLLLSLLLCSQVKAHDNDRGRDNDGGHDKDKGSWQDDGNGGKGNSVPIDGGLVILLAVGLGLGIKKIVDKKIPTEDLLHI
jgi:hypothetical protein